MFKIFVLVLIFGSEMGLISNQAFPTMEACEVERPAMVERLKVELTRDYPDEKPQVLSDKCDKAPE